MERLCPCYPCYQLSRFPLYDISSTDSPRLNIVDPLDFLASHFSSRWISPLSPLRKSRVTSVCPLTETKTRVVSNHESPLTVPRERSSCEHPSTHTRECPPNKMSIKSAYQNERPQNKTGRFDFANLAQSATVGKSSTNPEQKALVSSLAAFQYSESNPVQSKNLPHNAKKGRVIDLSTKNKKKEKKSFVCEYCERHFTKSYNLLIHTRTHTDERPYSCHVCDKRFRRRDHLRDHRYIHAKEKPFKCSECGKGFCQSRTLVLHRSVHMREQLRVKRMSEDAMARE